MLVLLQANVPNLGNIGELVKVKPGYARNFLFPRSLAMLADEGRKKELEHHLRIAEAKKKKLLSAAQEQAKIVSSLTLTVQKPVGEEDKIFGSVTTQELADAFKAQGHEFDRKSIQVMDDIKKLGVYQGSVKLHPEVSATFKIWVTAKN